MPEFELISPTALILAAILWVAVWTDVKEHRIPNALIIVLLCVGLTAQIFQHGPVGLFFAVGGIAVGLLLLIPFYIGGGMGAGDVKLMAAVGAMLGPWGTAIACAASLIAGLPLVLAVLGWRYFERSFVSSNRMAATKWSDPSAPLEGAPVRLRGQKVPYAAAIAIGSIAALGILGQLGPIFA